MLRSLLHAGVEALDSCAVFRSGQIALTTKHTAAAKVLADFAGALIHLLFVGFLESRKQPPLPHHADLILPDVEDPDAPRRRNAGDCRHENHGKCSRPKCETSHEKPPCFVVARKAAVKEPGLQPTTRGVARLFPWNWVATPNPLAGSCIERETRHSRISCSGCPLNRPQTIPPVKPKIRRARGGR